MGKLGYAKKTDPPVTGNKIVTTAGTAETLSTDHIFCVKLTIQNPTGNTGAYVSLGDANAHAANEVGEVISKGNAVDFEGVYLDEIYADVTTDGDRVEFTYQAPKAL